MDGLLQRIERVRRFGVANNRPSLGIQTVHRVLRQMHTCNVAIGSFCVMAGNSTASHSRRFVRTYTTLCRCRRRGRRSSNRVLRVDSSHFRSPTRRTTALTTLSPCPFFKIQKRTRHVFLFQRNHDARKFPGPIRKVCLARRGCICNSLYLGTRNVILSGKSLDCTHRQRRTLYPYKGLVRCLQVALGGHRGRELCRWVRGSGGLYRSCTMSTTTLR